MSGREDGGPAERMRERIAERDRERGRPLTASEQINNLCRGLLEIGEAERLSDADKDSIRARILTDIERRKAIQTSAGSWNDALRIGAIGALSSLCEAIEPWLVHRFDDPPASARKDTSA